MKVVIDGLSVAMNIEPGIYAIPPNGQIVLEAPVKDGGPVAQTRYVRLVAGPAANLTVEEQS